MNKISVQVLAAWELNDLVAAAWPQKADFDSVAEFEWSDGCDYLHEDIKPYDTETTAATCEVTAAAMNAVAAQQEKVITDWLNDDCVFNPYSFEIMNALCREKVIEAGHYLITVRT